MAEVSSACLFVVVLVQEIREPPAENFEELSTLFPFFI